MAGRGPVPKDPGHRRRYNQPVRGEWVDLEPLQAPILPHYRPSAFTMPAWFYNAVRRDPVTSQWGAADIAVFTELAETWTDRTFADRDRQFDKLGLTPKGKRDLRWRTPAEVKTIEKAKQAEVRKLRVVNEEEKTA